MNNQYLEHMNLITDAKRAIYELIDDKIGNNSYFLKQYLNNISIITNKNNKYTKILNLEIINSNNTPPKQKAEYLLDNNRTLLNIINQQLWTHQ